MPKSGGTFSGSVTFEKPTYFNDDIHTNTLLPKDSINSIFGFYKDTDFDVDLPRIYSNNCGEVFNNSMCLRYYTLNCSGKNNALSNLNALKKLFASMYSHSSSDYAVCVFIHGSVYVTYNDGTPSFSTSCITNYGYCFNTGGNTYVRKDGSVYVAPEFNSIYHAFYTSDNKGPTSEYDAYKLANEILVNNLSSVNYFGCTLRYVLAEHI